jgi:low affinity Fe/Cu permease
MAQRPQHESAFERIAQGMTRWAGSTGTFLAAIAFVLMWLATGPLFGFSNTWQLVINTCTTVVTFLMVFLIQRAHNKDALAVQLKLNELVAVMQGASNRLLNCEDLSEEELVTLHRHYSRLVELARQDSSLGGSHSIDEAETRHQRKVELGRPAPR